MQFIKNNKKYIFYFIVSLITISSIWNLKPLITGEIETLFIQRHIPNDYLILKDLILKQDEYFRTLWIPGRGGFGYYDSLHPAVTFESLRIKFKLYQEEYFTSLKYFLDNYFMDKFSVKYIVLPYDSMEEGYYSHCPSKYLLENFLDSYKWLKKIDIGANELVIYENENYRPHIYSDSGLNYYQTNASEFGDFSQNQNLYLNSVIEKQENLLGNLSNIIIPIEADPDKIAEMKLAIDEAKEPKEKKKLQNDLNSYTNNAFLKDFKLKIPIKAAYKIYIKKDSVLVNNKDISVKIDSYALEKDEMGVDREGWDYFNQIELSKGEYDFKLYVGNELIDNINSGDIVLSAENLAEPIQTPQLEYKQIYPTKYIVNVHQASESFPLIFSESFHSGWKIYVQPELVGQETGKFISQDNQGTIQNDNLVGGKFYDILFRKPVLDDKHLLINGYANSWWIDIEELEKQDIIQKRADGTYDFSIIIEFEPQKYFYIGLLVSSLTLLGCLGYLLYRPFFSNI